MMDFRKKPPLKFLNGILIVFIGLCGCVSDKLTTFDVPSAILSSFNGNFPGYQLVGIEKKTENDFYEIKGDSGTSILDVKYNSKGTIIEIEEKISTNELPIGVLETLKAEYPGARIKEAEKVTQGADLKYEVEIELVPSLLEVLMNPEGTILDVKEDETDDK